MVEITISQNKKGSIHIDYHETTAPMALGLLRYATLDMEWQIRKFQIERDDPKANTEEKHDDD